MGPLSCATLANGGTGVSFHWVSFFPRKQNIAECYGVSAYIRLWGGLVSFGKVGRFLEGSCIRPAVGSQLTTGKVPGRFEGGFWERQIPDKVRRQVSEDSG